MASESVDLDMTCDAARRYREATYAEDAAWARVEEFSGADVATCNKVWEEASVLQMAAHEAREALFQTVPETPAGALEILRVIVDQLILEPNA
jgi:hypothetical protein